MVREHADTMPVSKAGSVVSTRDGTETPMTDNEEPIEELATEREVEDFVRSRLAVNNLADTFPAEVSPLCPPPGLRPQATFVITRASQWSGSQHQANWAVDVKKFASKERRIVSPPFDFPLGSSSASARFRIMITAVDTSSSRLGASFKSSRGRGHVQLKCESPEVDGICFRLSFGNGATLGVLTHRFSESTVCTLPRDGETFDFAAAVDPDSANFIIRLEVAPAAPSSRSSAASSSTQMRGSSSIDGSRGYPQPAQCFSIPVADECKTTTQRLGKKRAKAATADMAVSFASERQSKLSDGSFKTQPCRFFMSRKGCTKGAACTYAHGLEELPERAHPSPNYKTRICSVYAKAGVCPLGTLCTFAHGDKELRQTTAQQSGKSKKDEPPVVIQSRHQEHFEDMLLLQPSMHHQEDSYTWPTAFCPDRSGPWVYGTSGAHAPSVDVPLAEENIFVPPYFGWP